MMSIARLYLSVAVYSYVVSASVLETFEYYSCEKGPHALKSENAHRTTDCEQTWVAESIPIGSFMSGTVKCISPCINLTDGEIIIRGCVNVTLTVICFQGHVTEYRKHFQGFRINSFSLQNYHKKRGYYGIWACLTLLLLFIVGFAIQCCVRQCHKLRNTRPIEPL